jgi:hypothetical protein
MDAELASSVDAVLTKSRMSLTQLGRTVHSLAARHKEREP